MKFVLHLLVLFSILDRIPMIEDLQIDDKFDSWTRYYYLYIPDHNYKGEYLGYKEIPYNTRETLLKE